MWHHIVAGLLKIYVRELSEPLVTFQTYPDFVSLGDVGKTLLSLMNLGLFFIDLSFLHSSALSLVIL